MNNCIQCGKPWSTHAAACATTPIHVEAKYCSQHRALCSTCRQCVAEKCKEIVCGEADSLPPSVLARIIAKINLAVDEDS